MRSKKSRQLPALALAACMAFSLVFSANVPGVFAAEDSAAAPVTETAPATAETAAPTATLAPTATPAPTQAPADGEDAPAEQASADNEDTPAVAALYADEDEGTEVQGDWTLTSDAVTVSGNGTEPDSITVTALTTDERATYTGNKTVVFGYNITADAENTAPKTITVTDCGIMSDDDSLEIWKIDGDSCALVTNEPTVEEGKISFTADSWGEYIAVSNVATVDLAKGNITVSYETIIGTQQDGTEVEISFSDDAEKKYRISQSDNETRVANKVDVGNTPAFSSVRKIILDGINTSEAITIAARETRAILLTLQLRNENQVHHIGYGCNKISELTIENYGTPDGTDGKLYIPYKMSSQQAERDYILESTGRVEYWAYAGIGGNPEVGGGCFGLTLAGGTIRVITQRKNGGTAIGGGGNSDAQISITGGDITAICSGTGTAIGGGIGWLYRGGKADVSITGGTVYAENVSFRTGGTTKVENDVSTDYYGTIEYGGVAIGSGSSVLQEGEKATIHIGNNSKVTAYARYGNAIGSGNSYGGTAALADITIDGNSEVTTNALGGGSCKVGQGGEAQITIKDNAVVDCVKYSEVEGKWDTETENVLDAFGIGGGNSGGDTKGGSATVTVTGGKLNCNGGNIGGGKGTGTGDGGDAVINVSGTGELNAHAIGGGDAVSGAGGDAAINVSGGTLNADSIGGGDSEGTGAPSAVTSTTQTAGVVVTGGTLNATTIGGGTNSKGDIGFATADISGGTIRGQFILANTDENQQCFFNMSGGTIDNTELTEKTQANGGAVYLTDPNGKVTISGGTIQNSKAALGGAVYMTAGTFTLSGTGVIQNCTAEQGGAVYLADGTVNVDGGSVGYNKATNGAGVYLAGGTLTVSDGTVNNNTATESGGGAYLAQGDLNVTGGSITGNTAPNGAGAYVASGTLSVNGGTVGKNTAAQNGGGAYLKDGTLTVAGGKIAENEAANGAGAYLAGGTLTVAGGTVNNNTATTSGGGAYLAAGDLNVSGGSITDNTAPNGAGAYLTNGTLTVSGGAVNHNTAVENGGGAYLAGGTLRLESGKVANNTAAANGGGAYVADGKVHMFGGDITGNTAAAGDGGGVYVSSASAAAEVVIRSGKVAENHSGGNGGGIAVVNSGSSALADSLTVGVRETHTGLNYTSRAFDVFTYTDEIDKTEHTHAACPVLQGNTAAGNGGGIYMGSSQATLKIYCLLESGNSSTADANGNSVMANGGTVVIGDAAANAEGGTSSEARGNIKIESSMLVESGKVDIYGNMDNPLFTNNILVNIKSSAGEFNDHRQQSSTEDTAINYRVDYFENFTAGDTQTAEGLYIARQYEADVNIPAESALFTHTGWVIIGWSEKADGTGTRYMVGDMIGTANDHSKWTNDSKTLTLYAIWQRAKYTVKYEPNATYFNGSMSNQQFEYGVEQALTANGYKVNGKRFTGWNTKQDGTGTAYAADYEASQMTADNNTEVTLYAQWVDCTHKDGEHPGTLTYTASGSTITETCDCGGHTAKVTLGAVSVYFDSAAHPATLTYSGDTLLAETPTVSYQYKTEADATYGDMPDGTAEPMEIGLYKASITVGGQTVSVEYAIKDATDGIQLTAKIAAGQFFTEFNGSSTDDDAPAASIPQDEAFTVQFDVLNLNTTIYTTAPVLTFGNALPKGTTIILNTDDAYWYMKVGEGGQATFALSDFTKMGGGAYSYNAANVKQQYRFVVDFSQADMGAATQDITLTYSQTNDNAQQLTTSARLTTTTKDSFGLQWTDSTLTVTAPAQTDRWSGRQLVAVLQAGESIPADAKLTAVVDGNTSIYTLNARRQFVVPLSWAQTQAVSLSLSSDLAAAAGEHSLTASLFVGVNGQKLLTTDATAQPGTLTVPADTAPALKLTGTQHVYTTQDTALVLTVEMKNTDGCTVSAEISEKTAGGYKGPYLSVDQVNEGVNSFSLGTIHDAGTYRLLVTVTKDSKTLLQVPYYFIVQ